MIPSTITTDINNNMATLLPTIARNNSVTMYPITTDHDDDAMIQ